MATNEEKSDDIRVVPVKDAHIVLRAVEVEDEDELLGSLTLTREDEPQTVTMLLSHAELVKLSEDVQHLVKVTA